MIEPRMVGLLNIWVMSSVFLKQVGAYLCLETYVASH